MQMLSPEEQLGTLFGSYKAEWLEEQVFDLFTEPTYWPELTTQRPCVLVGGRGTGKTTVLRMLSYEGQYALFGRSPAGFEQMSFIGFYERVDTNRVRAFDGPEVDEAVWIKIFAHYLNLRMAAAILRFTSWCATHLEMPNLLDEATCQAVARGLNATPSGNQTELSNAVDDALITLEAEVNNVGEGRPANLSLQKAPVDRLIRGLRKALPGRRFFFLFDEYENFTEYQQRVVNSIIKHSGEDYALKIGVREFGFRTRATLNAEEQLVSPADFVRVPIDEKLKGSRFTTFAAQVCNSRLARIGSPAGELTHSIEDLLPGLSEDQEAERLGVEQLLTGPIDALRSVLAKDEIDQFSDSPKIEQLLVVRWAENKELPLEDVARSYMRGDGEWTNRINNYAYALLFSIRRGRGMRGIQKYYCGWETFTGVAAGNIRYLLELVERTMLLHLERGGEMDAPVDPEVQTLAAQSVGRKNLGELEGLSVHGARLTKMVLGLGRVYQVLAADPVGHTPEVNEFELVPSKGAVETTRDVADAEELLRMAVAQLALLRKPGSKLASAATDTRDYDYRLHPIFSAFFVFSHRQKRKLGLSETDLLGLVEAPSETIARIVARHKRSPDTDLPEQLAFFESFYGARS